MSSATFETPVTTLSLIPVGEDPDHDRCEDPPDSELHLDTRPQDNDKTATMDPLTMAAMVQTNKYKMRIADLERRLEEKERQIDVSSLVIANREREQNKRLDQQEKQMLDEQIKAAVTEYGKMEDLGGYNHKYMLASYLAGSMAIAPPPNSLMLGDGAGGKAPANAAAKAADRKEATGPYRRGRRENTTLSKPREAKAQNWHLHLSDVQRNTPERLPMTAEETAAYEAKLLEVDADGKKKYSNKPPSLVKAFLEVTRPDYMNDTDYKAFWDKESKEMFDELGPSKKIAQGYTQEQVDEYAAAKKAWFQKVYREERGLSAPASAPTAAPAAAEAAAPAASLDEDEDEEIFPVSEEEPEEEPEADTTTGENSGLD